MLTSFPCCVSSCNSFSPTDNKFATCSDDGTVRIWDFLRCHEERILRGMFPKKYWLGYFRKGKLFSCPIRTVQTNLHSKVWHHFLNPSKSYVIRISKFSTIYNLTVVSLELFVLWLFLSSALLKHLFSNSDWIIDLMFQYPAFISYSKSSHSNR